MCNDSDFSDPHFNRLAAVHHESLPVLGSLRTGNVESGGTGTLAKVTLMFGIFQGVWETRFRYFFLLFYFTLGKGFHQCHSAESRAHHCEKNSQIIDRWTTEAAMQKTNWV